MRILVVEDDLAIRTWLKTKIESWGYEVDAAEDGIQAFDMYQVHKQELVITDWMMPKLDGLGLISQIRKYFGVGKTYIILISARKEGEDLISAVEAGADDYIVKPVQLEELHARIIAGERILGLERELQQKNATLEQANQQMKQDMAVAARIQQSFLPHVVPRFEEATFEWGLLPCDQLAGDALNVIPLDERHVGFYVLDVSGHGVAAALLAMTLIHTLSSDKPNSTLYEAVEGDNTQYVIRPPNQVAASLNNQFPMDDIIGQYFTFVYAILDLHTGLVRYSSGGHPGPLVIDSEGEGTHHSSTGMPIGFMPDAEFGEEEIQLNKGDRLYLFSDGIPESTNKYEEQFGTGRFTRILCESLDKRDLRGSIDYLAMSAVKWNGLSPMKDDQSILGLEINTLRK